MQLKSQQIQGHLAKQLAPIYVVSGDEPLQVGECLDAIRATARGQDFTDRVVMEVERGFDWSTLQQHADSLSLFADRRILELRMPGGKPGDAGAKVLTRYAENPSPDNLLLISTGKLDGQTRKTKWYKSLDSGGVAVQVWPIEPPQLPSWIARRLGREFTITREAATLLAERVEGNLLACDQEINKLRLLHPGGAIDEQAVVDAVVDSARFNVFDLVGSALAGNAARTLRIVRGLREEGVEPVLVVWALAREIRTLAAMARELERGVALDRVFQTHRVWDKRKRDLGAALRRHRQAAWLRMLREVMHVDRVIKGVEPGSPWDDIRTLGLAICGVVMLQETQ